MRWSLIPAVVSSLLAACSGGEVSDDSWPDPVDSVPQSSHEMQYEQYLAGLSEEDYDFTMGLEERMLTAPPRTVVVAKDSLLFMLGDRTGEWIYTAAVNNAWDPHPTPNRENLWAVIPGISQVYYPDEAGYIRFASMIVGVETPSERCGCLCR